MKNQRLTDLIYLLNSANLDALALNPGPTLTYITGLHFHLMERPIIFLLVPSAVPIIILPELEVGKLNASSITIQSYAYNENPDTWGIAFKKACQHLNLRDHTIGVEPTHLRFLELQLLKAAVPGARFVSSESALKTLRMKKDELEIAYLRQAVKIAQQAFQRTIPFIKCGVTERKIAAELSLQLLRAGADPELPFPPIIASGPNSANPHSTPTNRQLSEGDLVLIDWGAAHHGYCSDMTRMIAIKNIDPELRKIYNVVLEANTAARNISAPYIPAGRIDQTARSVISTAGYAEYFTHRTGHGLGMEEHEPPYIFSDNPLILTEGATFTIEPGIYLPGRGGVRLEDDILITAAGAESLTTLPRELLTL